MHDRLSSQQIQDGASVDAHVARKRRGRWWTWLFAMFLVLMAVVAAPFLYAQWRLRDIPDIGPPFDLKAEGSFPVAAIENAFEGYRDSYQKLVWLGHVTAGQDQEVVYAKLSPVVVDGWQHADDNIRTWMDKNEETLRLWKLGADRPQALMIQPEKLSAAAPIITPEYMRELSNLVLLNADRLRLEGDTQSAWDWSHALLRTSRQVMVHSHYEGRRTGTFCHGKIAFGIARWAADPNVTADQLRQAIADVKAIDAMTPPLSDTVKAEYFLSMNTITGDPTVAANFSRIPPSMTARLWFNVTGERELMRRAAQMVYANWLEHCDEPSHAHTRLGGTHMALFERDMSKPIPPTSIDPAVIDDVLGRGTYTANFASTSISRMLRDRAQDEGQRAALLALLSAELYFREHGEFPESLEKMLGAGLDAVPVDPFGSGEPIRYRRESDPKSGATVWSIGRDGVDNGGGVDRISNSPGPDLGWRIKPPVKSP